MADPNAALQPSFDPAKVTVPILRGILLEFGPEGVQLGGKKKDLIAAYERHVRPRAAELLAAREAVRPDGRGIVHVSQSESSINSADEDEEVEEEAPRGKGKGRAGRAAPKRTASEADGGRTPGRKGKTPKRAPKRELSDDELSSVASPKPKRRATARSTVEADEDVMDADVPAPSTSRRASKAREPLIPPEPEVPTDDAMDVDEDPYASPAVTKSRKSEPAPSSATPAANRNRRKSQGDALSNVRIGSSDGLESGFSDHNPFQRDSPDAKPVGSVSRSVGGSAAKLPRSGSVRDMARAYEDTTSRRQSMPAAAGWNDPPSPPAQRSSSPARKPRASAPPRPVAQPVYSPFMRDPAVLTKVVPEPEPQQQLDPSPSPPPELEPPKTQAVARRSKKLSVVATPTERALTTVSRTLPQVAQPVGALLLLYLLAWLSWYRDSTVKLGYCSTLPAARPIASPVNLPTNLFFDQYARSLGLPQPSCLPCPAHGTCEAGQLVACAPDFLRRSSAGGLGIGGLSLVPAAERCVIDPQKEQREARLALEIVRRLQRRRGEIECSRWSAVPDDPHVLGIQVDDLKEAIWATQSSKLGREAFDRTFDSAVQTHLLPYDEVKFVIDAKGCASAAVLAYTRSARFAYSTSGNLGIACRAKKASYAYADQHKLGGATTVLVLALLGYGRKRLLEIREDTERVNPLVELALERLQDKELAHHVDPVLEPNAYISPIHMRDELLPHTLSQDRKQRIWAKVTKRVLANSNVRGRNVQIKGEPLRVWEYTGAGTASPRRSIGAAPRKSASHSALANELKSDA